jgi:hypothetical protein
MLFLVNRTVNGYCRDNPPSASDGWGAAVKEAFRFPFRELVWKGYNSDQNQKAGNEDFVGVSWSELVRFAGYTGFATQRPFRKRTPYTSRSRLRWLAVPFGFSSPVLSRCCSPAFSGTLVAPSRRRLAGVRLSEFCPKTRPKTEQPRPSRKC